MSSSLQELLVHHKAVREKTERYLRELDKKRKILKSCINKRKELDAKIEPLQKARTGYADKMFGIVAKINEG